MNVFLEKVKKKDERESVRDRWVERERKKNRVSEREILLCLPRVFELNYFILIINGSIIVEGSFSCSIVNYMAGCCSAVSNIVMSALVLLTPVVVTPLFYYTQNAILGSIIISDVLGLIELDVVILSGRSIILTLLSAQVHSLE